ncbi:MAG: succinylglutamate desuccinylase/aspartoacylase family protein [bacterium]|nr:succinylglutamate desuccinylase/aspartoacylase family protein [bacterium]
MKKEMLFIVATHGDEPIGLFAINKLVKKLDKFDWVVGNPQALIKNQRYIDSDLNRSAPGSKNANQYEVARAAELVALSNKYKYTIDIHGTKKPTGIFTIITKLSQANLELASRLDIERVVIWPSFSKELEGSISENVDCGIEIECGNKDDLVVMGELVDILDKFLSVGLTTKNNWKEKMRNKETYLMVASLKENSNFNVDKLREFETTSIDGESFVPLFINSGYKERNGIICYLAKKISLDEVANLF